MLRAPEKKDVENIYKWENDPERLLHGRTGLPYSKGMIEEYVTSYNETALGSGHLRFIIDPGNIGSANGLADLYDIDLSSRKAFVSIYVDEAHRRKEIATQTLEELISFARDQLGLNQLVAVISDENAVSIRLFEKTGFKKIAELPQWSRSITGGLINAWLFHLVL